MLVTRPFKPEDADVLHVVLSHGNPQSLLPKEKDSRGEPTNALQRNAVYRMNELRKLVDEQRKPPPNDEFDGEPSITPEAWRKRHNLSVHFFSKTDPIVLHVPIHVQSVIKFIVGAMPNVFTVGQQLKHWEGIIESFRLKRWVKAHYADKPLPAPDGPDEDFDDEDESA